MSILASLHFYCSFTSAKAFRLIALNSGLACLVFQTSISAQVVPDNTLPQNSIVTNNLITGGTVSGTTLFHSFQEFSNPTGAAIVFSPNSGVQNIFARVTGTQRSLIDGLLAVNGGANLFLLNPNGITFGQNAQLRVNGSFIASTADSIQFAKGGEFSAKTPQAPPLLTISTPIGLQFGNRSASIVNQAIALSVPSGQTLGLAGGEIRLDNGTLTSLGGAIFLVSADSFGTVQLNGLNLGETNVQQFGNIELSGSASINASGSGGGAIQIRGGNVTLRDRARLISDTTGANNGQDIEIQADQFS